VRKPPANTLDTRHLQGFASVEPVRTPLVSHNSSPEQAPPIKRDWPSEVTSTPSWVKEARDSRIVAVYIVLAAMLSTLLLAIGGVMALLRLFQ
jgi:hypothetical protein